MNEKIVNVYELKSEFEKESYIYSLKKKEDYLGFNYYILMKDENNEITIIETENPLKILQNNDVNLIPITKDNPKYQIFLSELLLGLNNIEKKEGALSRK